MSMCPAGRSGGAPSWARTTWLVEPCRGASSWSFPARLTAPTASRPSFVSSASKSSRWTRWLGLTSARTPYSCRCWRKYVRAVSVVCSWRFRVARTRWRASVSALSRMMGPPKCVTYTSPWVSPALMTAGLARCAPRTMSPSDRLSSLTRRVPSEPRLLSRTPWRADMDHRGAWRSISFTPLCGTCLVCAGGPSCGARRARTWRSAGSGASFRS